MAIKMRSLTDHHTDGGKFAAGPRGVEGKEGWTPGTEYDVHSEDHARALVDRGIAERLSPPPPAEGEEPTEDDAPAADAPWTLQMEPDAYLAKFGDDKKFSSAAKAELARRAAEKK